MVISNLSGSRRFTADEMLAIADACFHFAGPLPPPTWEWYFENYYNILPFERRATLAQEIREHHGEYRRK